MKPSSSITIWYIEDCGQGQPNQRRATFTSTGSVNYMPHRQVKNEINSTISLINISSFILNATLLLKCN